MNNIVERNLRGRTVFKNESSLLRGFLPDRLPRREREIARLARNFKPLISKDGAFSVNVAIIGNAGVGKTSIAQYFSKKFPEAASKKDRTIKSVYYNCYNYRTKSAILRHLLTKHFNLFSAQGYSDTELLSDLMTNLKKEDSHLILILDEANVLGSEAILEFIYLPESFEFGKSRISIILISRKTEFNALLQVHLSERLSEKIELKGYNEEEMSEILTYRAELAFHSDVLTPEVLDQVISIATQTQNARHGIEILYNAGKIADNEQSPHITPDMVRKAKAYVYPELRPSLLEDLKLDELFTAIAVARNLKHEKVVSTSIDWTYDYYKIVCEEYEKKPKAKVTFRRSVDVLADSGIINKVVESIPEVKRGRRAVITIQEIPAQVLEEKCTDLLSIKFFNIEDAN
ncbi:MAG: AAA family ATPase [Candidatus Helarchaeota archaeon]|nr:AAA family ATPase [Candidatus Helarchaeota archaeon]